MEALPACHAHDAVTGEPALLPDEGCAQMFDRHPSGEAETAVRASEDELEGRQLLSATVRCLPTGGHLGLGDQPVATKRPASFGPSEAKTTRL